MTRTFTTPTAALLYSSLLCLAGCQRGGDQHAAGAEPAPVATVATTVVGTGEVTERLEAIGIVVFDPRRTRTLPFVRAGQVRQVLVTAGQPVVKGEALLRIGPLPPATPSAKRARIALKTARQDLERLNRLRSDGLSTTGEIQRAEGAVARARADLSGLGGRQATLITASAEGTVVRVLVRAGAMVQPGQDALELAASPGVVVRCGFEPEDAPRLAPDMRALVTPVFGRGDEAPARARLARLRRVVEPTTQLIRALVRPDKVPPWMVAGLAVRVSVQVRTAAGAVRVPRRALLHRDGRTGVFAVEGGVARWRPLKVGLESDQWVEASSGLRAGAVVATTGRTSLADGMAVAASTRAAGAR